MKVRSKVSRSVSESGVGGERREFPTFTPEAIIGWVPSCRSLEAGLYSGLTRVLFSSAQGRTFSRHSPPVHLKLSHPWSLIPSTLREEGDEAVKEQV